MFCTNLKSSVWCRRIGVPPWYTNWRIFVYNICPISDTVSDGNSECWKGIARSTLSRNLSAMYCIIFERRGFKNSKSGAIIGDGDRKRAPYLVLGLSPWYGATILSLEQIAPSPAAHARTCCEDFCRCRAGEMASEIPDIFHVLAHNSTRLRLLEFCLSIFVVSCSSLSEVRQCRI